MDHSLVSADSSPLRVVVVGPEPWRQTVTAGLKAETDANAGSETATVDSETATPLTISAAVDSIPALEPETLASSDCLLTCDRDAIASIRDNDTDATVALPSIYVLEPDESKAASLEVILEVATDVITQATAETPAVLAHRLGRALENVTTTSEIDASDTARAHPETVPSAAEVGHNLLTEMTQAEQFRLIRDATSRLLTADSSDDVLESVVALAADVLDLEAAVYRFDEQTNELYAETASSGFDSLVDHPDRIQPGDDIVWEAFIDGQIQTAPRDAARSDEDADSSQSHRDRWSRAQSGLYVPLGSHGVLACLSADPDRYDDATVELVSLFTMITETVLNRRSRTHRLREREHELTAQTERLERRHAVTQLQADLETHLLRADSRVEAEQAICDRLREIEGCSMVWIGEPNPGGTQLQSRAIAGRERAYLESVAIPPTDDSAAEPAGRAARTESSVSVENVAADVHNGEWRRAALSSNYQSVVAIPLISDGSLYGVVTLYGNQPAAFDDTLRAMLDEISATLASTLDSITRSSADEETAITEVELELQSGSVLTAIASQLAASVELAGATADQATSPIAFLALECALEEGTVDRIRSVSGVANAAVISDVSQRPIVQVTLAEPYFGSIIDSYGGSVRTLVATPETTTATITIPARVELRALLTELEQRGFPTTMLARRDRSSDELTTPPSPGTTRCSRR